MKTINEYIEDSHKTSIEKGFYEEKINAKFIGTQIALMHSELSGALEALRDGYYEMYFINKEKGETKPEGMVVEFADCLIRIFDLCGALRLDLERALEAKMQYNTKRARKHGRNNF